MLGPFPTRTGLDLSPRGTRTRISCEPLRCGSRRARISANRGDSGFGRAVRRCPSGAGGARTAVAEPAEADPLPAALVGSVRPGSRRSPKARPRRTASPPVAATGRCSPRHDAEPFHWPHRGDRAAVTRIFCFRTGRSRTWGPGAAMTPRGAVADGASGFVPRWFPAGSKALRGPRIGSVGAIRRFERFSIGALSLEEIELFTERFSPAVQPAPIPFRFHGRSPSIRQVFMHENTATFAVAFHPHSAFRFPGILAC